MFFFINLHLRCQGSCLNRRRLGRGFKYLLRDPASVNTLKLTCVIINLVFYLIPTKITLKMPLDQKIFLFYTRPRLKNFFHAQLS